MNNNNRVGWVDTMRGFLFFFVILTHSFNIEEYHWIYDSFFLTGFFFISGLVHKTQPAKDDLISIFNGLFVPWLVLGLITSLPKIGIVGFSNFPQRLFEDIVLGHCMWFICALIVMRLLHCILYEFLYKYSRYSMHVIAALSFFMMFVLTYKENGHRLPWNLDTALWTYGYFLVGIILKPYLFSNLQGSNKISWFSILLLGISFTLLYELGNWGLTSVMDMCSNCIPTPITFLCSSFIAIAVLLYAFRNGLNIKFLNIAGKYTLFAFAFHNWFIRFAIRIVEACGLGFLYTNPYAICYYILIQTLFIYYILIIIAQRLEKISPKLIGRGYLLVKIDRK